VYVCKAVKNRVFISLGKKPVAMADHEFIIEWNGMNFKFTIHSRKIVIAAAKDDQHDALETKMMALLVLLFAPVLLLVFSLRQRERLAPTIVQTGPVLAWRSLPSFSGVRHDVCDCSSS
jgi:hypothetical protein